VLKYNVLYRGIISIAGSPEERKLRGSVPDSAGALSVVLTLPHTLSKHTRNISTRVFVTYFFI